MNSPTFYNSFFDLPVYNLKYFLNDENHQYLIIDGTPTDNEFLAVVESFEADYETFCNGVNKYMEWIYRCIDYNNHFLLDMFISIKTIQLNFDPHIAKRISLYLDIDGDLSAKGNQKITDAEISERGRVLGLWKEHFRPFMTAEAPCLKGYSPVLDSDDDYFIKRFDGITFFLSQETNKKYPHETTTTGQLLEVIKKCTPQSENHLFIISNKVYGC
ncbi:hypothetical protein [Flavihumibacter sp. CACIAM 22H1]|uniref:hypothetical protein n=1 Tax=Flavihumibacter sp. CACIAM 22H1 TaxID=1812911 RepID=UPI0007A7DC91|nr:hypothetical protein [Flavihumibacter sp. CACIAM 22H1]KYP16635.1 MAG: hypothetical protein A1D16_09490 [Flavihumibacter sp. CACIAM 22H1]